MTYSEKLKDPRWQKKRLEIMQRDEFTCRECGDTKSTLHVHHVYYLNNRDPWDYEDENFMTLCSDCHYNEHRFSCGDGYAMYPASEFIIKYPEYKKHLEFIDNRKGYWDIITINKTDFKLIFRLVLDILIYDSIPYTYFNINGIESDEWCLADFLIGKKTQVIEILNQYYDPDFAYDLMITDEIQRLADNPNS